MKQVDNYSLLCSQVADSLKSNKKKSNRNTVTSMTKDFILFNTSSGEEGLNIVKSTVINHDMKNKITELYTEIMNTCDSKNNIVVSKSSANINTTSNCNYLSTITLNTQRGGNETLCSDSNYMNTKNNNNHQRTVSVNINKRQFQSERGTKEEKLKRVKSDIFIMLGEDENNVNKKKKTFYDKEKINRNMLSNRFKLKQSFLERFVLYSKEEPTIVKGSITNFDIKYSMTERNNTLMDSSRVCKYKNWIKDEINKDYNKLKEEDSFYSITPYQKKRGVINHSGVSLKKKIDLMSIASNVNKKCKQNYPLLRVVKCAIK